MKRSILTVVATFALLVPALASAQAPLTFVYRPEMKQMVPVPAPATGAAIKRTPAQEIARHEAMAIGYRGTRSMAHAAAHCDRAIKQARAEAARQF